MHRIGLLFLLAMTQALAAEVRLVFEPRWSGVPVTLPTTTVTSASGQSLRVTRLAALVSGISLVRANGETVVLTNQFGFVDAAAGRLSVSLSDVPVGEYTGIMFTIGLPAAVNHGNPAKWPAGHPLNPLVNRLHWNWKGGYVFYAVEGQWSDTAIADEAFGFSYHIAGDDHLMPVRFLADFQVAGATTIHLGLELSKLLGNRIALADGSQSTHSGVNDTSVPRLVSAIQRSVFWLGSEVNEPALAENRATGAPTGGAPRSGRPLAFTVPAGFPAPSLPADNPLTAEGIELGQTLFNDVRLSGTGAQSCASCHQARQAFSDTVALSVGADGAPGRRNAMPLFNLAWAQAYAWDGSKPRVRDQCIAAMVNPVEMHGVPAKITAALQADATMAEKFKAAFGTPEVTTERIGLALEQCLLTNIAADSKFDRAQRGETELSEEEKEGFALFMTEYDPARGRRGADCFHCHGGPLFTDYDYKNNGLDRQSADAARQGVTGRATDAGKFKTPSLRNVAVTAPYMHDGRFSTLDDVIAHYDHGVERSHTLDPNLAKHPNSGLQLNRAEQRALVAFLRTLTDSRWEKQGGARRAD
jgi:cytochrome c peroxidase